MINLLHNPKNKHRIYVLIATQLWFLITPLIVIKITCNQNKNQKSSLSSNNTNFNLVRKVTQYKSRNGNSKSLNSFTRLQSKNFSINDQIELTNKSTFNYLVKYSKYNCYGLKNDDYVVNVKKNSPGNQIKVADNSISSLAVKVSNSRGKWANLSIEHHFVPTHLLIQSSIKYVIGAVKSINEAEITLDICYANRSNPSKIITTIIGHFHVNNLSKKTASFFTTTLGKATLVAICTTILAILVVGAVVSDNIATQYEKLQEATKVKLFKLLNFAKDDGTINIRSAYLDSKYCDSREELLQGVNQRTKQIFADCERKATFAYFRQQFSEIDTITGQLGSNSSRNSSTIILTCGPQKDVQLAGVAENTVSNALDNTQEPLNIYQGNSIERSSNSITVGWQSTPKSSYINSGEQEVGVNSLTAESQSVNSQIRGENKLIDAEQNNTAYPITPKRGDSISTTAGIKEATVAVPSKAELQNILREQQYNLLEVYKRSDRLLKPEIRDIFTQTEKFRRGRLNLSFETLQMGEALKSIWQIENQRMSTILNREI